MSQSVYTEPLPGNPDVLSVLSAFENVPFIVLLDSAAAGREQDGRYTFLTADPVEQQEIHECSAESSPFQQLRAWQQRVAVEATDDLPPFCGGVAGLMSYDLGRAFERLPTPGSSSFSVPVLTAGLFDWAIVWDHVKLTVTAYVLRLTQDSEGNERQQNRIRWIRDRLRTEAGHDVSVPLTDGKATQGEVVYQSRFTRESYCAAVQRVIDYIAAGDIFQANLSQQLTAEWPGSVLELYGRVRRRNAAPFCGMLTGTNYAVVSASPERFLCVSRGGMVETRPIKGTRRRQQSPIADLFTSDELLASEKDRAENVMIVDLLRNDISRVCRIGSVRVTGVCEVEVFETVQHLVSTVVGELRADCDVWDLCAACFPGGSITGAPKIRAMEIIAELEPVARGAYCGSLFYCGPQGDFDSSILIRTFTVRDGQVSFPVGGGIVADSDPEDEYNETLHKASGMLRALRR